MLIAAERIAMAPGGRRTRIRPGFLRIEDGLIVELGENLGPAVPDVELRSGVLAPGLVDLQVNGCGGHDLIAADAHGWQAVAARLPETGVTSFLATFISAPIATLEAALRRAAETCRRMPPALARILGIHLEGPFLSPLRPGAHDPAFFRDPASDLVDRLLHAGDGFVRMMTLAPERREALDAIARLSKAGVVASVGHSDASADQARRATDAGARSVTHLFNAQSGVDHRSPGVAAHALTDRRLTLGLIADLVHVAPSVCRLAFAAAAGRVSLVSDAVAPAGLPAGDYWLGDALVQVPEQGPPVRADGVLFGSRLRLDTAIANLVGIGIDPAVAIDAASRVPADLLGRHELGRLTEGAAADLVFLDNRFRAQVTWIGGDVCFSTGKQQAA